MPCHLAPLPLGLGSGPHVQAGRSPGRPRGPRATGRHPRRTGTRGEPLACTSRRRQPARTAGHGSDGGLETGSPRCQGKTGSSACQRRGRKSPWARCSRSRASRWGLPRITANDSGVVRRTAAVPASIRFTSPVRRPRRSPRQSCSPGSSRRHRACARARVGTTSSTSAAPLARSTHARQGARTAAVFPRPVAAYRIRSWPCKSGVMTSLWKGRRAGQGP